MRTSTFLSIAAALSSTASATIYQGFNYGSTFTGGAAKKQADFEAEFTSAKNLVGTSGAFTSARLYTMIVCSPLVAEPAIICRF
jgi:glucan endo-1,3-beta-D-glucosidase